MAVIEAYREAYEQRDLERFMHLWGQRIRDRDMTDREELQQRYAENFASLDKIRYELTNVKMSPLTGGRVRVSARYRIGAILRSAGEEIVGEGHIRWTLRKEDGELRIVGIDY